MKRSGSLGQSGSGQVMDPANQSVKVFMETSTIHGLAEIYRSKSRAERIIFVLAFIICIGFMVYGCYQIIMQYIQRPVATSYFIEEADHLQLPDVTICPFNRFNSEYLAKAGIDDDMAKYMQWAFFLVGPIYEFVDFKVGRQKKNFTLFEESLNETLKRYDKTFEQFLDDASLNCSNIVRSCMKMYLPTNCCDTSEDITTSFGKCHRLKGEIQESSGFGMGVTIMIDLPLEKYTVSENMALNDGVMLKLTEPGKGYEFDAIFLPPGVHALIQLRATQLDFMNDAPRYHCEDHPDSDYAPLLCFHKCMLRYVGIPAENSTRHLPICRPTTIINCAYKAIKNKIDAEKDYAKQCKDRCKPRCSYWQYHSTVSYSSYPSRMAMDHFLKVQEDELFQMRNRKIVLEIYYDKLEYTLIKHFHAVTTDQFLADIGGQIGLWIGASILSVIHMLVFFFNCAKSDVDKHRTLNAADQVDASLESQKEQTKRRRKRLKRNKRASTDDGSNRREVECIDPSSTMSNNFEQSPIPGNSNGTNNRRLRLAYSLFEHEKPALSEKQQFLERYRYSSEKIHDAIREDDFTGPTPC